MFCSIIFYQIILNEGLHKELIRDEMDLKRLLLESCENRVNHVQPVGGTIDTSCAVWEIELCQSEKEGYVGGIGGGGMRTTRSR